MATGPTSAWSTIPLARQCPMFDADRVDLPAVAVQPHRQPSEIGAPEVPVEPLLEIGGQPLFLARSHGVVEAGGQGGPRQVRSVDVALNLAEGDRGVRHPAIVVAHPVPRVLPALVGQPACGRPPVADVPVAGGRSPSDPRHGPVDVVDERSQQVVRQAPAAQLADEDHEQRRRVDRSEVRLPVAERRVARVDEAHLVEDPPRLLLGQWVVLIALEVGQRPCHAVGEDRVDGQRHQAGDDRVPPEEGHEPRRTGGDRPAGRRRPGRTGAGRRDRRSPARRRWPSRGAACAGGAAAVAARPTRRRRSDGGAAAIARRGQPPP